MKFNQTCDGPASVSEVLELHSVAYSLLSYNPICSMEAVCINPLSL
jgi:hypothetical protein